VPQAEHHRHHRYPRPFKHWDVYVDDFIVMVQSNANNQRCIKSLLLASFDKVLQRLKKGDGSYHQDQASVKKMLTGDATWATRKLVLDWLLDTVVMTIQLGHNMLVVDIYTIQ
jgi:ABC-type enterobactin transport system permease subunit